eukprot:7329094-Pyramimonas_sp.AAC.1
MHNPWLATARHADSSRGHAVGPEQEGTQGRPGRGWEASLKVFSSGGAQRANGQPCPFASQIAPHLKYADIPASGLSLVVQSQSIA